MNFLFTFGTFILFLSVSIGNLSDASSDYLKEWMKKSLDVAETMPFDGTLLYKRQTQEGEFVSKVKVCRLSPTTQKMVVLEPDYLKNHTVAKIENKLWMSSISEEDSNKLPSEIKYYLWFKIFRINTAAIQKEDLNLVFQNYTLSQEAPSQIAGREVHVLFIQGKNRKRPTLRLWIDKKTLLPLKYERFLVEDQFDESIEFVGKLLLGDEITVKSIQTDGLEEIVPKTSAEEKKEELQLDFTPFQPKKLPYGFVRYRSHTFQGHHGIVYETQYKDGLAYISTYQRKQTKEEIQKQLSEPEDVRYKVKYYNRKGRDVHFRELSGIRISAVGTIHPRIIRFLLYQMEEGKKSMHPGREK